MRFKCFSFLVFFVFSLNAQVSIVTSEAPGARSLAFKDDVLYFGNLQSIYKIDVTQPDAEKVLITAGLSGSTSLAINGNFLYFTENYGGLDGGKISKIDLTADTINIVEVISGLYTPYSLAFKDNDLYIADRGADSIYKIDITQASPSLIDVVTTGLFQPISLLFDGNDLYIGEDWDSFQDEEYGKGVFKMDITASNPTLTLMGNTMLKPTGLAIFENTLYIKEADNLGITSLDLNENPPIASGGFLFLGDISGNGELEIKDNELYFAESQLNKISKYSFDNLSLHDYDIVDLKIYPNPSNDYIYVLGSIETEKNYTIYNPLGKIVLSGSISERRTINIQNLDHGIYFLKFDHINAIKFIKN
ncbi:T9SS type A sorting domain-containing protein [Winogradskyella sp.]|uniref:T9SS type A sorting domain-containing protein n=1 Tax=Winogradskyella sp. TaxID=1883156 RepID=UPI003BAA3EB5